MTTAALVILLAVFSGSGLNAQADPLRDLAKSKDPRVRLRAIAALEDEAIDGAESALIKAARGDDWEVAEHATRALAIRGSASSIPKLVALALGHPLTVVRDEALRAAARIDAEKARALVGKKLRGKEPMRALEALRILGLTKAKKVRALAEDPRIELQSLAWEILAFESQKEDEKRIANLLRRGVVPVRLGIVRGLARRKSVHVIHELLTALRVEPREAIQRRIQRAIVSHLALQDAEGDRRASLAHCRVAMAASKAQYGAAFVDLLAACARGREPVGDSKAIGTWLVDSGLGHEAPSVRAAAARVLGELKPEGGREALAKLAIDDEAVAVRFQALNSALAYDEGRSELLAKGIAAEKDAEILEEWLAQCGKRVVHPGDAKERRLEAFLAHADWRLATAAAVSIGRLRSEASIPALEKALGHTDWRYRGSAAAGLGEMRRKAAFPGLLKALEDDDPFVRNTAQAGLIRLTRAKVDPKPRAWKRWWKANGEALVEIGGANDERKTKLDDRYDDGFRDRPYGALEEATVVVFTAPRDDLTKTLNDLKIEHSLTRKGEVLNSALHPHAVLLVNCPGVLDAEDVTRIDWFVRVGGSMFTTCTSLANTVQVVFPGLMAPPTRQGRGGAMDATPVRENAEFVRGVFDDHARPRYQLVATFTIRKLRRERVRCVLDSVQAAAIWGEGDLASYFRIGHGLVMDSSNHFVLQGMGRERMKTDDDRRAFALERLGLSYREVRELDRKRVFKSHTKATKACPDRTMMRLIARFVFARRALGSR